MQHELDTNTRPGTGARAHVITRWPVVIGRHSNCDVVIGSSTAARDPTVSRRHLRLELLDGDDGDSSGDSSSSGTRVALVDTSNPKAARAVWLNGKLLPRAHTATGGETRTPLASGARHLVEVGEQKTAVTIIDPDSSAAAAAAAAVPVESTTASSADCIEVVLLLDSDDGADEDQQQTRRHTEGGRSAKRPRLAAPGPAAAAAPTEQAAAPAALPEHTIGEEIADGGSGGSRKRLMRDLKRIKTSVELQMFRVEVRSLFPPPSPSLREPSSSPRPFVWLCNGTSYRL